MFGAVLVARRSEDKSKSLVYMSVSGGDRTRSRANYLETMCRRTSTAQHKAKALRWLSDGSVLDGVLNDCLSYRFCTKRPFPVQVLT